MASYLEELATIHYERRYENTSTTQDAYRIDFPLYEWQPVEWSQNEIALINPYAPIVIVASQKRRLEIEYREYSLFSFEQWVFVVMAADEHGNKHIVAKENRFSREQVVSLVEKFVAENTLHGR